jgi:hypothetical protein
MGSPTTESGFLYLVSLIPLGQRMRVGPMKLVVACCGPPVFPAADISHRHRAGSHGLVGLAEVGMNPNLFSGRQKYLDRLAVPQPHHSGGA